MEIKSKGKMYLVPNTLGGTNLNAVVPSEVKQFVSTIRHFVVENEKSARALLKLYETPIPQADFVLFELNKHGHNDGLSQFIEAYIASNNIGIISDAGCAAIADPGSEAVAIAHLRNIEVVPFVGPSSILLALMASGFNGQNFAFNGYLPIDKKQKEEKLKTLERLIDKIDQTQIFIETPYRNNQLLKDFCDTLQRTTMLCIAANLTLPDQWIKVKSIKDWKGMQPDLNKKPCIFLLHK